MKSGIREPAPSSDAQPFSLAVHGFRSSFRDQAAECTNVTNEVAEAALAHAMKDKIEAAYDLSPPTYGTAAHVVFATAARLGNFPGIGFSDVETTFGAESDAPYGSNGSIGWPVTATAFVDFLQNKLNHNVSYEKLDNDKWILRTSFTDRMTKETNKVDLLLQPYNYRTLCGGKTCPAIVVLVADVVFNGQWQSKYQIPDLVGDLRVAIRTSK